MLVKGAPGVISYHTVAPDMFNVILRSSIISVTDEMPCIMPNDGALSQLTAGGNKMWGQMVVMNPGCGTHKNIIIKWRRSFRRQLKSSALLIGFQLNIWWQILLFFRTNVVDERISDSFHAQNESYRDVCYFWSPLTRIFMDASFIWN